MAGTPRFNGPSVITKGFVAAEALAAYRLVIVSTDTDQCEYPASQYDPCIGVTLHAAASGAMVDVCIFGLCLVQVDGAAATITALTTMLLAHNDAGYAQAAAGGAAGLRRTIGMALATSSTDGDIIPMLVTPGTNYYAA
jgi:hypothetical protein